MTALILTGSFGMGHNSCANAIAEHLSAQFDGIKVKKIDIWNYILPSFEKLLYASFNILANKHFSLYNSLKVVAENQSRFPFEEIISHKMHRLMQMYHPDLVISTLSTSSTIMSNYKGSFGDKTPFITCITDIRLHKDWVGEHTDYYCVGAPELQRDLIAMGVPPQKIYVTGIPVSPACYSATNAAPRKGPVKVLVMGGGLGLLPEAQLLLPLLDGDENLEVTLIAGKNKELFEEVSAKYKNIKAVGYTDKVADYMRASNVLVSKPGGITMFEAINCALPMLTIKPFLAQEMANADFIENRKIGTVVRLEAHTYTELCKLISDERALADMRSNMLELQEHMANLSVCDLVAGILSEKVVA